MKIRLTSVPVADQEHALGFYTGVLGFEKKLDLPLGEFRWPTVVSADEPETAELLLEPDAHPAAKTYQQSLFADGIPIASLQLADLKEEFGRLSAQDVRFVTPPTQTGDTWIAVFDDTCGNLIQLYEAE